MSEPISEPASAPAPRRTLWDRVASRTRALLSDGLNAAGGPVEPGFYEDLDELLVAADLGPTLAAEITAAVRARTPSTMDYARTCLREAVVDNLARQPRWLNVAAVPSCVLLYGVNGAGKTTSAGKLAHGLRESGRRVLLIAADTYRAAGIEQAQLWAERAGVECFAGSAGGDCAATVFDGLKAAQARGFEVAIVDTAGRLQTQQNLLAELAKVSRVAGRALEGAPHESLLVLDGNLGQSNLHQARGFNEAVPISGLVLTKMDGTAKGGAVLAIERALGVPTKMIGVGEGIGDLYAFEPAAFAAALFAD